MKLKVILLWTICFLTFWACEEKTITQCKYYNLCDSSFYCSFELDNQSYELEQYVSLPEHYISYSIDTATWKQNGWIFGLDIPYEKFADINSFTIETKKFFNLTLFDTCAHFQPYFMDSMGYRSKQFSYSQVLPVFEDTLSPTVINYSPLADSVRDYYDSTRYTFPTEGFAIKMEKDYTQITSILNANKKDRNDSSFFYVTKIEPYLSDIYFIEAEFQTWVYSTNDTLWLKNGHMKGPIRASSEIKTFCIGR